MALADAQGRGRAGAPPPGHVPGPDAWLSLRGRQAPPRHSQCCRKARQYCTRGQNPWGFQAARHMWRGLGQHGKPPYGWLGRACALVDGLSNSTPQLPMNAAPEYWTLLAVQTPWLRESCGGRCDYGVGHALYREAHEGRGYAGRIWPDPAKERDESHRIALDTCRQAWQNNSCVHFGAWRSLVARLPWAQEVRGSNPRAPTIHPKGLSTKGGFFKKYHFVPLTLSTAR